MGQSTRRMRRKRGSSLLGSSTSPSPDALGKSSLKARKTNSFNGTERSIALGYAIILILRVPEGDHVEEREKRRACTVKHHDFEFWKKLVFDAMDKDRSFNAISTASSQDCAATLGDQEKPRQQGILWRDVQCE
ncbi:hypothetical protein FRB97_008188 [Tulasnella sp. 331]|nr:hypothetical protein FRB97_008188 [Tulasnella sp. 331]